MDTAPVQHVSNKETKEALVGLNEVSLFLAVRLRDGAQAGDFLALWEKLRHDDEFKAKLEAAYQDANKIPAEVADFDLSEGLELVQIQMAYVPKLIAALKKPADEQAAATAEAQVEAAVADAAPTTAPVA